jgi:putative hemolysin
VSLPTERDYETAAGLVLTLLGHLPRLGEVAWLDGWGFEVIDLDGQRIDKLLVRREAPVQDRDRDDRRAG